MALSSIKFSLLTLLMVLTITALAIAVWQANWELIPLRKEVAKLRDGMGILTIADKNLLHAISIDADDNRTLKWNVHVPRGSILRLDAKIESKDSNDDGAWQNISTELADQESECFVIVSGAYDDAGRMMFSFTVKQKEESHTHTRSLDENQESIFLNESGSRGKRVWKSTAVGVKGEPLVLFEKNLVDSQGIETGERMKIWVTETPAPTKK